MAFTRVKWLPETPDHTDLIEDLLEEAHTVIVTIQRWNGKASLNEYTSQEHYKYECNRFRLHGEALQEVEAFVDHKASSDMPLYICDRKGLGCGGCGLCARLTLGTVVKLSSLNLSSSGFCPHSCPDCYAKAMQAFQQHLGHNPMTFDVIKQNAKQAGHTKHIKNARKAR